MKEQGTGTEGDARKQVSRKKKTKKNRIAGGEKLQQRNREGRTIGREGDRVCRQMAKGCDRGCGAPLLITENVPMS